MNRWKTNPLLRAAARAFRQPPFISAVLLLLLAAVGLNAAVLQLKLTFKKLPVPLSHDLTTINSQIGDWVSVRRDEPLDHDLQEELGTDKYIFRDYLNLASHDGQPGMGFLQAIEQGMQDQSAAQVLDVLSRYRQASVAQRGAILTQAMQNIHSKQRHEALARVQSAYPDAVVNMAVTYYTGLVDTVAHIPDRCYIAGGYEPTDYDYPTWTLADGASLPVRFINFQNQDSAAMTVDCSVAYFFSVNGQLESSPLAVRQRLQNLFQRYGYYAKVELMTLDADHARSARTMTQFLSGALPLVKAAMPDWKQYESSRGKST